MINQDSRIKFTEKLGGSCDSSCQRTIHCSSQQIWATGGVPVVTSDANPLLASLPSYCVATRFGVTWGDFSSTQAQDQSFRSFRLIGERCEIGKSSDAWSLSRQNSFGTRFFPRREWLAHSDRTRLIRETARQDPFYDRLWSSRNLSNKEWI